MDGDDDDADDEDRKIKKKENVRRAAWLTTTMVGVVCHECQDMTLHEDEDVLLRSFGFMWRKKLIFAYVLKSCHCLKWIILMRQQQHVVDFLQLLLSRRPQFHHISHFHSVYSLCRLFL